MRSRRRLWIILLAMPIVLAVADTLYWYIVERNLAGGFAMWLADRRADGWTASTQPPTWGGWPLAATLSVPRVILQGGEMDIPGGLTWSADQMVLRVALWRPGELRVTPAGSQRLRLAAGPEVPFTADRMRLVLPVRAGVPPRTADVSARNLRVGVPMNGDVVTVGRLTLHMAFRQAAQSSEPALAFSLHAETIDPPQGVARALGPRIAGLTIEGTLDGPVPTAQAPAQRAADWRDGGGALAIQHLVVNWGPLDLSANAKLSLDGQLQPMGSGNVRAVGYAETLDALATHGAISRSAATAAKAVLSLLAHNPEDGSAPDVEVPLNLQSRTLSMRQVPLVKLPELVWR